MKAVNLIRPLAKVALRLMLSRRPGLSPLPNSGVMDVLCLEEGISPAWKDLQAV